MFKNLKNQYCKDFPKIDIQKQCHPNQNPSSLSLCEDRQANSKMYMDMKRIKKNQDNPEFQEQCWEDFLLNSSIQ